MALDLSRERYGSKASGGGGYVSADQIMNKGKTSGEYVSAQQILSNIKPKSARTADTFLRTFISDTNKFISSAERDTSEENGFNAADFFEERKKLFDRDILPTKSLPLSDIDKGFYRPVLAPAAVYDENKLFS